MDRSPRGSWQMPSSNTPEKSGHRIKQLEREVGLYRDTISERNKEIEYLNQRNSQLMQGGRSIRQSDDLYETSLQDQLDRLSLKLADKTKEYERLYQKHLALENDMATLEDFATDLDRERKFLADKMASIEIHTEGDEIVGELENKLVLMSTEIMRLGQLNRNKNQDNNELRFKLKEKEEEKEAIENELSEKDRIIMQFREKIRNLEKKLHEIEATKEYENESTYKLLSTEIERLNIQLHNKMEDIGTLEHKINVLVNQEKSIHNSRMKNSNIDDLEIEVEKLRKINMNYQHEIIEMEVDLKRIKRENKDINEDNERNRRLVKKLEEELDETKRNYIKDQNEKIKIEIETSERTIREQKHIIDQLNLQKENIQQQKEFQLKTQFEDEVSHIKMMFQKSEKKCSSLQADLMKYEEKLVMLSQEVERLSLQNVKYQEENAELNRLQYKIESKERELKEILRTKESVASEMKRDKDQIEKLTHELHEQLNINRELESKALRFSSIKNELEVTNQILSSKEQEYRILEQKLHQQTTFNNNYRVEDLENQLESERKSYRLKQEEANYNNLLQINNYKDTVQKLEIRIRELASEQSENTNNYGILADEIRRLNEVLSESSNTIIKYKRDINLLESNLQTAQQSIEKMKGFYISNDKVEQEIYNRTEVYKKELQLHQEENRSLQQKMKELLTILNIHEKENNTIKIELQDTKQQIKRKEDELIYVMDDIRRTKQNEDNLIVMIREIKESNIRLERKLAEIEQDYMRRLEDKSNEKQRLEREYIENNRKVREAENENNDMKIEISTLRNKLEIVQSREMELQNEKERLQYKIDEEIRSKSTNLKYETEEYQYKLTNYEKELKNNAKYIGELETQLKNKAETIYKIENNLRQIQEDKEKVEQNYQDIQQNRYRELEAKGLEERISIERYQNEITIIRRELEELKEENRKKERTLEEKNKLIFEYENKLAMLSQELERINLVILSKNQEIHSLSENLQSPKVSKEDKETIEILSVEITRLNTILCETLEQVKDLEQEVKDKNREIKRSVEVSRKNEEGLKDRVYELEQEIETITRNNHAISANAGLMNRKIEDFQKYERDNEMLRTKLIEMGSEQSKLKNTITDLESQISILKNSFENNLQQQQHSLSSKASIKITEFEEIKRQLERKVTMLVSENEQLVSQIQNLKREIQNNDDERNSEKRELIRAKNENVNLLREKEKYRLMSEEVMEKIEKVTFSHTLSEGDKSAYEFRVKHLESVIKEYESQIMLMKQELDRSSRDRDRSRENSSTGSSNMWGNSKNPPELQQKYNILESLHLKLKREAETLREKITEYEFKMKKLKGEFDLINKLTHEYKDENDYLRQQSHSQCIYVGKTMQNQAISLPSNFANDRTEEMLIKQTLTSEIDRLGILNANLRKEIEEQRLQVVDTQALKQRYEEFMAIFVLMAAELDALRIKGG